VPNVAAIGTLYINTHTALVPDAAMSKKLVACLIEFKDTDAPGTLNLVNVD
jgi:hypothetical protein